MARSLYIHVPFCLKKCGYCDFYSISYNEPSMVRYVAGVKRELALKKDDLEMLHTLYFGGGTPSLISPEGIGSLMEGIRCLCGLSEDAEVTIEANPSTITRDRLEVMRQAGVNRISVGVQSFFDRELALLGRIHDAAVARLALEEVHTCFDNFSIDLIYGIPGQTMKSWHESLEAALSYRPNHLSFYELTLEEHTALGRAVAAGEVVLPDEDRVASMYETGVEFLLEAGYHRYEISNFALPGYECRHNVNYWKRGEYVGAGPAAHSFIGGRRFHNVADAMGYLEAIEAGVVPMEEVTVLSELDCEKERIFLGLRLAEGIGLDELSVPLPLTFIEDLTTCGLVEITGNILRLTTKGILMSNQVMGQIMRMGGASGSN